MPRAARDDEAVVGRADCKNFKVAAEAEGNSLWPPAAAALCASESGIRRGNIQAQSESKP